MVVFDGNFDLTKFRQCLKYVQHSLDWLIVTSQLNRSQTSVFSPAEADETKVILNDILCHQLNSLHNARAPVNCLPSEIFSHVLLYLKDDPLPFPHDPPGIHSQILGPSPPTGQWHRASGVCCRWRQEVKRTLGLWTMIKARKHSTRQWVASCVSNSGALPLSVVFDTRPEHVSQIFREYIPWMLSEGHRIRTIYVYQEIELESLKPIFSHLAGQLETLMAVIRPTEFPSHNAPELLGELPRLRTLSIAHNAVWQAWTMRELRHLSLTSQRWRIKDLRAFFTVLKTNPHLEELMLSKITADDREAFIQESSSSIYMPELQRLFMEQFTKDDIDPIFSIVHRTLSLPSTCTRYYNLVEPGPLPVTATANNRHIYTVPVERVVASSRFFRGTDGISACLIERETSASHFTPCIENTQVKELWLDTPLPQPFYSPFGSSKRPEEMERSAIKRMNKVTKLVIMRDIAYWLQGMENAFPDLKELQIYTYYMSESDRGVILRFLVRRKRNGLQLNALHILGPPVSHGSQVFNKWRAQASNVEPLANKVVFEKVRPRMDSEDAQFSHLVSTRLGLPEVCKHASKIHTVWKPWNAYIALTESRIHQQLQGIWQQVA